MQCLWADLLLPKREGCPLLGDVGYSTGYLQAESAAKRAGAGIWRGEFEPPWEWRAARH
jgi:hypothetical protein